MVNTDERPISEGETVSEEGACGVEVSAGGADAAPPTGGAGGKGRKRGKRSRQGHRAEKSAEEAQVGRA